MEVGPGARFTAPVHVTRAAAARTLRPHELDLFFKRFRGLELGHLHQAAVEGVVLAQPRPALRVRLEIALNAPAKLENALGFEVRGGFRHFSEER
jgi:hypothetical protein